MTPQGAMIAVELSADQERLAKEVSSAVAAGAGIVVLRGDDRSPWQAAIGELRRSGLTIAVDASNVISADVFSARPDIACLPFSDTDLAERNLYIHRTLAEMVEFCELAMSANIGAGGIVANSGAAWTLDHLWGRGLLADPVFVELPFAVPGGQWAPASFDALTYRLGLLSAVCIPFVSVAGIDAVSAKELLTLALAIGAHVVVPAARVEWACELASALGRVPARRWPPPRLDGASANA